MNYTCIMCGRQVIARTELDVHWVKDGKKWRAACKVCEELSKKKEVDK